MITSAPVVGGRPSRRDRVIVACLAAAIVATLAPLTDAGGDFSQLWAGARALLVGADPYQAVGPGRSLAWPWPLYYPAPALLVAIPFSVLSLAAARVVWVTLLSAIFAYAVTAEAWWGLLLCAHLSFLVADQVGQLAVLLAVSLLIPGFGFVIAGKPTTGFATLVGASTWRAAGVMLGGAAVLFAASFAFDPTWVTRWLEAVRYVPHMKPLVARPWGWLLLVTALRWRLPAARVLCAIALLPTTLTANEALPALVALRPTRKELLLLAALSWVSAPAQYAPADNPDRIVYSAHLIRPLLAAVWLPLAICILRRPNVGRVPSWVEALVGRWPAWLRGQPDSGADA